mmetsp:Transcript_12728/g.22815  ORF Transcript_12728/g.22815 Transcript_12728/m.22815 type:complete len:654 (-) Transcript_12728:255-2216(-)
MHGPQGPVHIQMPEDGVLTAVQSLKKGSRVNAGAQLAFYRPAIDGIKLPSGPGLKVMQNPAGGTFKRWRVSVGDKIQTDSAVADFVGQDGKISTVHWSGPNVYGMVFQQQKLSPGTGLKAGADLITTGAGVFGEYKVKPGDVVNKGDPICNLLIGIDSMSIPARVDGSVVLALGKMKPGEVVGFNTPLKDESFCTLGKHLPMLPPEVIEGGKVKAEHEAAPDGKWMRLQEYKVGVNDKVKKGDTLVSVTVVDPDDTNGPTLNITAKADGFITEKQAIKPGDIIGPHDDLIVVGEEIKTEGGFPWWLLLLLFLVCCIILFFLICCRAEPPEPAPPPMPMPPAPASVPAPVRAPDPMPSYAMQQSPARAPPPPPHAASRAVPVQPVQARRGVPIYFDNMPFYFEFRPIGIKFQTVSPIKIDKFIFNSYGKTLGLREGQRLTRINDFDVRNDHHYQHVDAVLLNAIKDLPYWPLQIDFKTQTGDIKHFSFVERPLGILFTQHLPIKVDKFRPHSLAQRRGVQAGWEIMRIADEDTSQAGMHAIGIKSNKQGYDHVDHHLVEGLDHLPFWRVRVDFKNAFGDIKSLEFSERPMGCAFTRHAPIRIEKFKSRSIAQEMGALVGWEILRIGDETVRPEHDSHHVDKVLEDWMHHLPERR